MSAIEHNLEKYLFILRALEENMTIDEYIDYYKKNGYIKEMRKYVGHE